MKDVILTQNIKVIIMMDLMQIGPSAVWWTLKRYVINNRAIKFGQRSSNQKRMSFAERAAPLRSASPLDNAFG